MFKEENIVGTKAYFNKKYGEETVQSWIESVEMEDLMKCMDAFSNESFIPLEMSNIQHRNKELNILEMILQEIPNHLYRSVTYGVQPNTICTDAIGDITGRKYGNVEIASFLIEENISELKEYVLENHCFTDEEINLLHFFKERKGVIYDDLDDYYVKFKNIDRFDIEEWFNDESEHNHYIMLGKAERYDIKGSNANGYFDRIFDSLLEAIDEAMDVGGICYTKIYENGYGKLFVDIIHHDGHNSFEIRKLTKNGEEFYNNHYYDEDIVGKIINNKNYTKNVNFSKNY